MQKIVDQLKEKRQELSEASEQVIEIKKELDQTELGLSLIQAEAYSSIVSEELKAIEDDLRHAALNFYNDTSGKNPIDGVSVIINKSLVYDLANAVQWAVGNAIFMLKLDKAKFDKHAKAIADTVPLDFVTIKDEPAVRIAKKL